MNAETPKAEELNLPQAVLLLATNDKDGEPDVPQTVLRAAVAGAILAELDLIGAIELQGKHVRATGTVPPTDFQHQLQLIRDKSRPHTPKRWVSMLESRAELHRVYEGMASLGVVDHVGERHLGLFRTTRYPEKDHAPEAALLQKIQAGLGGGHVRFRAIGYQSIRYRTARSGSQDHSPDRPAPRGGAAREDRPGSGSKPGTGTRERLLACPGLGGRTPHDQTRGGRSRHVVDPPSAPTGTMSGFHAKLVQAIVAETNGFDAPVYLINADSHVFAENQPLAEGSPWLADDLQRLTVDGSANAIDHVRFTVAGNSGDGADVLAWERSPSASRHRMEADDGGRSRRRPLRARR